ncbi:hypothetical protein ASG87_14775 [Frateuria sp. Soil773]|uniref:YciI family protein n=1 Tax=Frateuria sp. Soil773 TaxID=1736407 RepID=UPI0006F9D379|nr:YciI family protein [Frateuria sp. Soil773]KRE97789.1 hypothetical protein ASG87_14775 [Frateuria sp. Soil773]
MNDSSPSTAEYLVISRGQWHEDLTSDEIQAAIDAFYDWHGQLVAAGRMRVGQRLARAGKRVSARGVIDGPFAESKEIVGGYWFIVAESLDAAAELAAGNPCLACGLSFEIRPIETARASADAITSETPGHSD